MSKKFTVETGYHGVHKIVKGAKKYTFVGSNPRNLETLCDLLNSQDAKIKELEHRIRELEHDV